MDQHKDRRQVMTITKDKRWRNNKDRHQVTSSDDNKRLRINDGRTTKTDVK